MRPLRERLVEYLAGDLIQARVSEVEGRLRAEADGRVREALSAGMSRADQQLLEQGFRRLTSEHSTRDLQPLAQDRMLALAYWLYESNPLAQWLVDVQVDFVWGEGGKLEAADEDVKGVLKRFWEDPVNQLEDRLDQFIGELGLQGELCLPVFINWANGHVRLGYVDPVEIKEVQTHPDNALVPLTVVLKSEQGGRRERLLKVVREETSGVSPYSELMMPALPDETDLISGRGYDGSCLLIQINKLSGARRGRSDLLSLIDWLDGYDALLFDQMDGAQLLNSFIWDVTLKGMTEEQIQAWLANNRKIRRGMVRAHNEQVEWKAEAPDLKATDKDTMLRMLRGHILGARSIPEHYYGLGGEVNLATAKEMGLPTLKRMTRRQKKVRAMLRELARFAIHQAIVAGTLRKDVDQTVTVELPEISTRDTSALSTALAGLASALTQAETQGWLRKATAARLFALVAGQLGIEINPAEEVTPPGQPTDEQTRDYDPAKVRSLVDRLGPRP